MVLNCPNCGKEVNEEYIFCPYCEYELRSREHKSWDPFHLDIKDAERKADKRGIKIKLIGLIIILIIGISIAFLL